jgi:hypothetical protein
MRGARCWRPDPRRFRNIEHHLIEVSNIKRYFYITTMSETVKECAVDMLILLSKYIVGGDGER